MLAAPVDASELYLSHRESIDRTISSICRRNHASYADAEEFRSATHLHLIDRDYAVLRAYQGRADLAAFLYAVIRRLFQDWRNAHWGRWRPSVAARRGGPIAIQLETLLMRDRRPIGEAIEVLRTNHGVTLTAGELEAMAATFPPRTMPTFTSVETLAETVNESSSEYASASVFVDQNEAVSAAGKVSSVLAAVMNELSPQDQLILRMRFENGAPVSTISRLLGVEQQPLYRRVDKLLAAVRARLEAAGVGSDEARDALHRRGFDLLEGGRS